MRTVFFFSAGVVLLITLSLLSIAWGAVPIALDVVVNALLIPFDPGIPKSPMSTIVLDLRLPRSLLAICVGAGLGIVGSLLQTITRNDLADPFLFGLSSGAAAGAVSVITVFGDVLGIWTLPFASFAGGMLAAATVIALVKRMGSHGPAKLILAGLAVSFLFSALTNYLVFAGDQRAAHSVLFWSLGGLGLARWGNLPYGIFGLILVLGFALKMHRQLDAILAGEQTAQSLGVNIPRLRLSVFMISACSTAIFVSLTGVIGFIGLMVPHVARWLGGPMHRSVILLSGMMGSLLLISGDLVARLALAPQELPVGIITTTFGGLFVFVLLIRQGYNN